MTDQGTTLLRATIIRFPLIVGVLYIHNYSTADHIGGGLVGVTHASAWVNFVMFFISEGLASAAVPLFLTIAGYLFFLGLNEWSWKIYIEKLKRRVHTLLIPFVFWNLVSLLFYAIGRSLPQTKVYFAGTQWPPADSSFVGTVGAMFGITTVFPIAGSFWFIRDLMALILLAPAIHFVLTRRVALPFLVALFAAWYLNIWPVLWPGDFPVFFFCLGAFLSLSRKDVALLYRYGPWITLSFVCLITMRFCFFPLSQKLPAIFVIVSGVPSVWWLTSIAINVPALKLWLLQLSDASFFVFAAHGQLEIVIRKLLYKMIVPTSGVTILALYLLIPFVLIVALVITYRLLLRTAPSVLNVIAGSSYRNRTASVAPQ